MDGAEARHWPEYFMEAALLGLFMVSAGLFGTLLEYPGSPVRAAIGDPLVRRALMGLAMGVTAAALIYSPWGQRSGAHFNPAVTLTFWRLGKVRSRDALAYAGFQAGGALAGVLLVWAAVGSPFADPAVAFVVTRPGTAGTAVAFAAEVAISGFLMLVILEATNRPRVARFTGLLAGALVALYIAVESPLSGMSINPARTFGSSVPSEIWTGWWVYLTAPPLGMLLAAELYRRRGRAPRCAKLHHQNDQPCIFRCGYAAARGD
jgi:aquaporin Z